MIQRPSFWLFLAAAVLVHWLLPARFRLWFLTAASIGYLLPFDPLSVCALVAWSALFFHVPHAARDGRIKGRVTPVLILAIVSFLAFFKYIPRLLDAFGVSGVMGIVIPLGISFYTFKLIHYALEVGRGNIRDRSLSTFLCYMFLFPIFTAGPIERYDHFIANREMEWRLDSMVFGITRIMHGLIKKFVIGTALVYISGEAVAAPAEVFTRIGHWGAIDAWGFLVLVYLYAYMDFSAYSDIAIGASRLFGLRIMENFNFPIVARNISDFWKRWHMTLAAWCQAYIYLPTVGLTRNPYAGVIATFFIIGLWHAGTLAWVSWGLYHGIGVSAFLTWSRIRRRRGWLPGKPGMLATAFSIGLTFAYVSASFAFTVLHEHGTAYDGLRLFAKLFFVDLPA